MALDPGSFSRSFFTPPFTLMARPKVDTQIARAREERAWDLRALGWTHTRIAVHLGVDRSTVSKMLDRVAKRHAKEFSERVAEIKAEHTERLEHIYRVAMASFDATGIPQASTPVLPLPGAPALPPLPLANVAGDAAYLKEARAALKEIRSIWGADEPQKVEHSGEDGGPIQFIEVVRPATLPMPEG